MEFIVEFRRVMNLDTKRKLITPATHRRISNLCHYAEVDEPQNLAKLRLGLTYEFDAHMRKWYSTIFMNANGSQMGFVLKVHAVIVNRLKAIY